MVNRGGPRTLIFNSSCLHLPLLPLVNSPFKSTHFRISLFIATGIHNFPHELGRVERLPALLSRGSRCSRGRGRRRGRPFAGHDGGCDRPRQQRERLEQLRRDQALRGRGFVGFSIAPLQQSYERCCRQRNHLSWQALPRTQQPPLPPESGEGDGACYIAALQENVVNKERRMNLRAAGGTRTRGSLADKVITISDGFLVRLMSPFNCALFSSTKACRRGGQGEGG